jgi:hypothetical protein
LDLVSITLCLCIGNAVAWVMAIYSPRGAYNLLWNVALGSAGAAVCGFAAAWTGIGVGLLLLGGPLCALRATPPRLSLAPVFHRPRSR